LDTDEGALGAAVSVESAGPLTFDQTFVLGTAVSVESAATLEKGVVLGTAVSVESAGPLTFGKTFVLGTAVSVDIALTATPSTPTFLFSPAATVSVRTISSPILNSEEYALQGHMVGFAASPKSDRIIKVGIVDDIAVVGLEDRVFAVRDA